MKPKVLIYSKIGRKATAYIQQYCETVSFDNVNKNNHQAFMKELNDAVGLIGAGLRIDEELLQHAPRLKVVSNVSVGYDNLDVQALAKHGIMATNTPDVLNETVADLLFGMLLASARRIPKLDGYVKEGKWGHSDESDWFSSDVHHKTIGIIGMGGIGTAIAKRARFGFDMEILYHNRTRNEDAELKYEAKYRSLPDLLKESDFVVLMTPLTKETEKLMGVEEFNLMKKSAFFINGSRGRTVDESALINALQEQEIKGAALDVFEQEPIDKENPLLRLPNVITLPHVGSATYETRLAMAMLAAENVVDGVLGKEPKNSITEPIKRS